MANSGTPSVLTDAPSGLDSWGNEEQHGLAHAILEAFSETVLYVDAGMRIRWANPAALRVMGLSLEGAIGQACHKVLHGQSVPCRSCPIERVFASGTPQEGHLEAPHARHWHVRAFPLLGPDGSVRGAAEITFDVTEQHRVAEALRQSEERFLQLAENAQEWIWEVDADGRYTYASPVVEKLLGYEPAELVGRKCFHDLFHPDDRERTTRTALEVFAARVPFREFVNRNIHRDGHLVWLSTSGVPIVDENGNLRGYRGADTDVTERIRSAKAEEDLRAQVQQSQKLESLGLLAGGIAHDFNNLLMGILGNASLALAELPPVSPVRTYVEKMERAGRLTAELTQQLLAYAGKARLVTATVNLSTLVRDMHGLLEVSVGKRIALKLELSEGLPGIKADATQLRQVVLNLVSNAAEAVGEEVGTVWVRTGVLLVDEKHPVETQLGTERVKGRCAYLEVSDTGCGIDPATRARMFDPFFSTKVTGRGLGLATVLGIVRSHRAGIEVQSGREGSVFRLLFPVLKVEEGTQALLPQGSHDLQGGKTILVVDDEQVVLDVTRRMLETCGFRVLTATNGREGIEVFQQHKRAIAIVLLDATMPVMNGEEAFCELRRIDPAVRVILSSGYDESNATERFVGRGLAAFIQKPYGLSELIEILHKVLDEQ